MDNKSREKLLKRMILIIRKNPGIRPSKINALLKIPHTAGLRNILMKRGFIIKKRSGNAVHYFYKNRE